MAGGAVTVAFGGTARVYCVHNMAKRVVTELGFNPAKTSIHMCSCCENVFLEPSDGEMFCDTCRGPLRHKLGGPLPAPAGRIT